MVSEHQIKEYQIKGLSVIDNLSDRLFMACRICSGNTVEIGAGEGYNTLRFIEVGLSRTTNKWVVVVDPFEQIPGEDESYFKPYPYEKFEKTVNSKTNYLAIAKFPSQHPVVKTELENFKPIGFIYIDGLQTKEAVLSDLKLAESLNAEIICVDDYNRETASSQVKLACIVFGLMTDYRLIYNGQREAYFIK